MSFLFFFPFLPLNHLSSAYIIQQEEELSIWICEPLVLFSPPAADRKVRGRKDRAPAPTAALNPRAHLPPSLPLSYLPSPKLLGRGAYGEVIRCTWKAASPPGLSDREVAVKVRFNFPLLPPVSQELWADISLSLLSLSGHLEEGMQGEGAGGHARDRSTEGSEPSEHREFQSSKKRGRGGGSLRAGRSTLRGLLLPAHLCFSRVELD